jgi:hypothetical protein
VKKHIYHYENLVIGSELNAAMYAKANNFTLIQNSVNPPFVFEKDELCLWNRTLFSLSIAGNLPLSDKVSAIRVGEGQITVSTKNNRVIKLSFDKLVIFDDENIQGLDVVKSAETSRKKVLDWFDVRSGMSHNLQKIETGDDFVNKILFYPTTRLDGFHPNKKDLVVTSFLDKEQLNSVEYSDSYIRLKTLDLMKQHGIRGNSNGKGKFYALQIEHSKREFRSIDKNTYKSTEKIDFCSSSYEEMILGNFNSGTYLSKVEKYFSGGE